jgi:glycine C-acetyltransferase/8-amino-7-oxononanoate synthase
MYATRLDLLARRSLLRRLRTIDSAPNAEMQFEGRRVLLFSSNNYLDLATHPKVTEAAAAAIRRYGVGAGASRLISGTLAPHVELEERLASFKRTDAAIVFSTGYHANIGLIQTLAEDASTIYADRFSHASLIDGCRFSKTQLRIFRHRDASQLRTLLESKRKEAALILTDGVFSMDGDLAPLPALLNIAESTCAQLVVDDAHGTGVMGHDGRGTAEHFGLTSASLIQMGTLSKALGAFGGFVAGSRDLITYLVNRARSFIYTTALPPAMAAAASAALEIIIAEPERRARLWFLRDRLGQGLKTIGCGMSGSESPIMPILVADAAAAVRLSDYLLAQGVYAPAIRPPTVPSSSSRIRITVTAGHTPAHIDHLLEALYRLRTADGELWERLTNPSAIGKREERKRRAPSL